MKKIPLIIDCDPGIDDAVALVAAFAIQSLDIKAITTVAGNLPLEITTKAARTVLGVLKIESKIYKGASCPLMGEATTAELHHGNNGLAGFSIPDDQLHALEEESALDAQIRILTQSCEPVDILAIGPLTNIALLIKSCPEVKSKINQISIMGGGYGLGNHSAAAEFNFVADPEAANIVFNSGIPIIIVPLNTTHQTQMDKEDIDKFAKIDNDVAKMLYEMLEFTYNNYKKINMNVAMSLHDLVALFAIVYPEMMTFKDLKVDIETQGLYSRGASVPDLRAFSKEKPNCRSTMDINVSEFNSKLLELVKNYS